VRSINKYVYKQLISYLVVSILIIMCIPAYAHAEDNKNQKNVLIINSYHEGFPWTKDQTDGIMEALKQSGDNFSTYVEYMDWKNYPSSENLLNLYDYLRFKYKNKKIDVLIATDDVALDFVLKNRDNLFSNAPVVFSGVNIKGLNQITTGYKNFTGVMEEIDPVETIKMAKTINPSLKNVYLLYDNSESGISTGQLAIDSIMSNYKELNIFPLNNLTYNELVGKVSSLDNNSIILVTTYYRDAAGNVIDFKYLSKEISKYSNVPVYHIYDMGLNNGAFGGSVISGRLQGENAGRLAVRITNGESADSIPYITKGTHKNVLDYEQLIRFQIPLSKIPKDIEIINKPFSFFNTYRNIILPTMVIFFVLIVFVCILLFYLIKIERMKKHLSESHEELTMIYEELAASDEELKQQFDEIYSSHERIKSTEEKLAFLAYFDSLTGLPNKQSLYENSNMDIFNNCINEAALMFIDMDHFKNINDTMGHAFGDELLKKTGERLATLQKENSSVYRLSGDEFIITMKNVSGLKEAEALAKRIIEAFAEEFIISNSVIKINFSIGIALYPKHGENIEELLKHADIAMYKAKSAGRNNYVVYNQQMNMDFIERVNIEKHLNSALDKNEFQLHYQPQLDIKTNKITGFEALLRWHNEELGHIPPDKFIKIAESTHLIISLGDWVLRKACGFLKNLHDKGHSDLSISVNISMLQLLQKDFSENVIKTLESFGLKPENLELEITESILMESYDSISTQLEKLNRKGVKVALDDFGKGYSSLSYLKQLPISVLKIDKSFIDSISNPHDNNLLAGYIVDLGKKMGMCVVAEGVETKEQLEYLAKYDCNRIQGFLYSKPVSEDESYKLLDCA